ncbi:MAG: ABC transporter permease [Actinomycetota bacterium]|nr:ABC transporter permease [Actinomycetota bacterium]
MRTRRRFWVEVVLSAVALLLCVLTLINGEWIEVLTGLEPDGGSGETEWFVAAAFGCCALALAVTSRLEWRRTHLDTA